MYIILLFYFLYSLIQIFSQALKIILCFLLFWETFSVYRLKALDFGGRKVFVSRLVLRALSMLVSTVSLVILMVRFNFLLRLEQTWVVVGSNVTVSPFTLFLYWLLISRRSPQMFQRHFLVQTLLLSYPFRRSLVNPIRSNHFMRRTNLSMIIIQLLSKPLVRIDLSNLTNTILRLDLTKLKACRSVILCYLIK